MSQLLYYRVLRKSYISYHEGVITCVTLVFLLILFLVSSFTYDINDKLLPEIIAWLSLLVYTVSRVPQIYLNWRRRSVYGLSYISFICITLTNFCFAGSIFAHLLDKSFDHVISKNLQWIIGMIVTIFGDAVIMYQFHKYKRSRSVLAYTEIVSNDTDTSDDNRETHIEHY